MRIRPFTMADYDAAAVLWKRAEHLGSVGREDAQAKLQRDPELFLVMEDQGAILGTVMGAFDGHRGWIYRLAVDPARRRQGIGTALVDALEDRFREIGVDKVNLLVVEDNKDGQEFWERLGYTGFSEVRMHSKRLDGSATDAPGC